MNFDLNKSRDAVRNTSYGKKTRYRFRQTYLKLSSLLLNRGSEQMQCSKCSTEDTYSIAMKYLASVNQSPSFIFRFIFQLFYLL